MIFFLSCIVFSPLIYMSESHNNFSTNLILSSSIKTKINSLIKDLLKKNSILIDIKSKPKINTKYIIGDNSLAKKILKWKPSKNIFDAVNEIFLNS